MKRIFLISFTDNGQALAEKLAGGLNQKEMEVQAFRCGNPLSLSAFASQGFRKADALIFVGAMGIAVRAIAPHVVSKVKDPAVVVIDEKGNNTFSVLSGHLGGGNELTQLVAEITGANPVITTATDVQGVFAIDLWTKKNNCKILRPDRIKVISAALLSGEKLDFVSDYEISGQVPKNIELRVLRRHLRGQKEGKVENVQGEAGFDERPNVLVSIDKTKIEKANRKCLVAVPQIAYLGVGCRKGTTEHAIEECFEEFMRKSGISADAICLVCSIDLKKDEEGLISFCKKHELEFKTFSAEQLSAVEGEFSGSDFVQKITGVDNVCERSAICGSGGIIVNRKMAKNGVTMAIATAHVNLDWRL